MWNRNDAPAIMADPRADGPALVGVAQEYVQACDLFDRLQGEYGKLNEELKRVDDQCKELREKLLHLINEADVANAARWELVNHLEQLGWERDLIERCITRWSSPVWVEWLMGFPLGWTDLED